MWNERKSPLRIEKRFEFGDYQNTSKFMKQIDLLCKERNIYPNISFGKNFLSVTIFLDSSGKGNFEKELAFEIDKFFESIK